MPLITTKVLLLCLAYAISFHAMATSRVALVIGNSDYQHINPLKNARHDAEDMAAVLTELGFTLYEDKAHINLTIVEMIKRVEGFVEFARGKEIALVYYAGHGLQIKNASLLGIDVPSSGEALIKRSALDIDDDLLLRLDGKAHLLVAIFDACRTIPQYDKPGRSAFGGSQRGFEALKASVSTPHIIAYSGGVGQTVEDGYADGRNSPYTSTLLQNLNLLKQGAAGLAMHELLMNTSSDFKNNFNLSQNPQLLIQSVRADSRFVLGSPSHPPSQPAQAVPSSSAPPPALVKAIQRWLTKHGYPLSETGVVDTRTQLSIRDFEQKEGLLITGEADRILLQQLEASYWRKDEAAWQQATKNHTLEGYENYLSEWQHGRFRSVAEEKVISKFTFLTVNISEPIVKIPVNYPLQAKRDRLEGWVRLRFSIMEDGSTDNIEVIDANPQRVFDREAIRALRKWKFEPLIINGEPKQQHHKVVQVNFKLP